MRPDPGTAASGGFRDGAAGAKRSRGDAAVGAPVPVSGTRAESYQVSVRVGPETLRREDRAGTSGEDGDGCGPTADRRPGREGARR